MISNAYANRILNAMFGVSDTISLPANMYLGLCASAPAAADGTVSDEPTVDSYSRVVIGGSSGKKYFSAASGGTIANSLEIQFKTAREAFGKMYYFFLSESASGNAILWGQINDGDGVDIAAETVPVFYEGELRAAIDTELT